MRTPLALALLSSLLVPVAGHAAEAAGSVPALRVTTGVVPPVLLNANDFTVSADALSSVVTLRPAVVLSMTVNEKGVAENVRVVKPVSPKIDEQVLSAARGFQFRPATLDQQAVAVDMTLTVFVQR